MVQGKGRREEDEEEEKEEREKKGIIDGQEIEEMRREKFQSREDDRVITACMRGEHLVSRLMNHLQEPVSFDSDAE